MSRKVRSREYEVWSKAAKHIMKTINGEEKRGNRLMAKFSRMVNHTDKHFSNFFVIFKQFRMQVFIEIA